MALCTTLLAPAERRHAARGYTIIETVIAAGVFSFGVLALVPLFVRGTLSTTVASQLTQATTLAESKLDQLLTLPFTAAELLRLYDANGSELDNNDDMGFFSFDSRLIFHPTTTGTFFFEAGSFFGEMSGSFTLSV